MSVQTKKRVKYTKSRPCETPDHLSGQALEVLIGKVANAMGHRMHGSCVRFQPNQSYYVCANRSRIGKIDRIEESALPIVVRDPGMRLIAPMEAVIYAQNHQTGTWSVELVLRAGEALNTGDARLQRITQSMRRALKYHKQRLTSTQVVEINLALGHMELVPIAPDLAQEGNDGG